MMSALDKRIATLETLVARDIGTVRGFEQGLLPPLEGWFALVCAFLIKSQPVSTPSRLTGIGEERIHEAVQDAPSIDKALAAFTNLPRTGYAYGDRGELGGIWVVENGNRIQRDPNTTERKKCVQARNRLSLQLERVSDEVARGLDLDEGSLSVWERAFLIWQMMMVLFLPRTSDE